MIYTALDTFYLSNEQISNSPSRKDGVEEKTEMTLRLFGCELIQESGILLRMPQAVMATGQVLFHRFYCKKSFARFNVKRVAASCVWLAAKLEECPRRIRDILNVFYRIERRRDSLPLDVLDPFSKKYEDMKTDLITTERHLLKEMGFICHVEHPHKFIINYLKQLDAEQLMQEAWSLANDSLRTTLCVQFKSEVVACGVVYAAARRHLVALPELPPWWETFDAKKSEIDEVCKALASLYQQPTTHYIEVGKDSKSFVLTSRAWDPPPDGSLLKLSVNGAAVVHPPLSSGSDGGEHGVKEAVDKQKHSIFREPRKHSDEAQLPSSNGDPLAGKAKQLNDREDGGGEKSRDKERERASDRDRDRDRDRDWEHERERDRDRVRDRDRDREKERDREKGKDRDHRLKDRSRDSGHSEKSRHHSSSREREFQSSHAVTREKDRHRHRHHPYA